VECQITVGCCIVDVQFSVHFSFPKPLSTLIPIRPRAVIMPASAPRSPATSKSKQRATSKRKANDDSTKDGHARKRTSVKLGAKVDDAHGQSEEALFKIRHAAEFDTESVEDDGEQVQVKQEQQEDEITVWSPMRLRSATRTPRCTPRGTKSIPDVTIPQATSGTSASRESVDQEGIFVAILSQGSCDLNMTKSATENLSQRARQVAVKCLMSGTSTASSSDWTLQESRLFVIPR
jgi:hypothetical protein